ncbi:TPA: plasmid recombination protein [Staphylococcus aureus]|uniref:MobV family relaxase n=1 Tax=Staphylococcus aureus TaxID=1280 RepID=UPI000768D1FD|nr:MobV family relaxase [Staphylococcus aureus]CXU46976.1 plasmid recombination enzyme type 3 (Plasmid recombinase)(Mobilization protein) [Staphylococcus aureus]SUM42429.1 plasmid recombination enzyme type 3 (Plasmid recombinase)(Mobilization protein) [Staphylococcus aureus]HDJ3236613.1 plasmid recombination protein [Staphylococcus aureus]HDJ3236710.1 plasmid recombination protein [Staphylococcus aureus]HDJ3419273.1 plasmid recombination protein [Staphylococcus aureus]
MSYSIVRVSKVKSGTNTTGIQKHVQRENNNYENEDIDHSKTYLNYDLVNANKQNFNNLIDEKIEQNYTGKRKIRTDAIKHIDGLITSDNDFFDNQTPEDTKQFFEYAKEFLEQEYGKDNLLYATVHMDEKTPHMHYGVVPITDDGRLSAKEVVGNKKALTAFQDRFNEHVKQRGYDLERGQSRQVTNAKHEQISQYKQKTEYHKQEYERESQKTDHIKQKNDKLMQEYQKSLNTLKKPINVPYEQETEKVGGLFSKEIQENGNVVISQKDFNEFQKQIKAAQDISEDYEYIKSGRALDDKDKEIREKDDLLNKAVERIENADDNFNQLYENAKPLKENIEIALKLLKILLKELERVLGRNTFAERVNKLTEDEPKLNGLAGNLDKKMNPELYSEQEQQQEQQKNQKRDRGMHL